MSTAAAIPEKTEKSVTAGRSKAFTIFFIVLAVIGLAGFLFWWHSRQFETTDDAQVDGHLNPISARVDGTITKVYVDDNQVVKAGDPLVDLDPRDFQVAVDQAEAQLAQARTQVIVQQPNVPITLAENTTNIASADAEVANAQAGLAAAERDLDTSQARLAQSEATNARAQADLARYQVLISKEEVSQQEFDQIGATAKAQAAEVAANKAAMGSANHVVDQKKAQLVQAEARSAQYRRTAPQALAIRQATVKSEEAAARTAQAELEQAQLNLSYTRIVAPVDGILLRRSAEVGAHISAGQQLLQIAQISDLWVTANFKETQTRLIRPGQSVSIRVDALKQDFDGTVETIGATTGAVASVLPPENATGNFVKVVQRLPIRIRFKPNQNGLERLRPGMSVEPQVKVD
jgi:membrane fusion protein (multidrug efflux system)